jgi:hypothetical protein
MSDDLRRVSTLEERDRFNAARSRGGLCAACGRTLGEDETVYIEQMLLDRTGFGPPGVQWSQTIAYRDAPLGAECASPGLVARMREREPEQCGGCGRPMYYAQERAGRQQAVCSKRCHGRFFGRAGRSGR